MRELSAETKQGLTDVGKSALGAVAITALLCGMSAAANYEIHRVLSNDEAEVVSSQTP